MCCGDIVSVMYLKHILYFLNLSLNTNQSIIHYISGRMFAFIRDCSDGLTFSIHDVPRFGTLKASLNHTTCAYMPLSKIMACVTLCDTDFCNGPQIDSGKEIPRAQKWIILSLVMTLCIIHIN